MRALILASDNPRGSLAAARCLASAGWWVGAASADTGGPLSWSRVVRAVYDVPPPQRGLDAFVAGTAEAVERSRVELVLPASDAELLALSAERDRIPAVVPLADDHVVRRSVDKLELTRAADAAGLAAPRTEIATDEALADARYPAIVKSRFHWLPDHGTCAPPRLEAAVCRDETEARRHVETMRRAGGEPLLQEFVAGAPVYVHLVTNQDGAVQAQIQQQGSGGTYPPGAGQRTRSRTVALDPYLETRIPALMRELGWFGFVGLAFQRAPDGTPYLIDFNGRLPTALEGSAGAGANYVAVWAALATGREVPQLPAPRMGMRYQNLETDLRRATQERRGGLARDVAGTMAFAVGARHTLSKWSEPWVVGRYALRLLRQSRHVRRPDAGVSTQPSKTG